MRKKIFRQTLTSQFMFTIWGLVVGTVVVCLFVSSRFLSAYHSYEMTNSLRDTYEMLMDYEEQGTLYSADSELEIRGYLAARDISLMIKAGNGQVLFSASPESYLMEEQFVSTILSEDKNGVLVDNGNYFIKSQKDPNLNTDYLILYGILNDGNFVMMRVSLESISQSVRLSNRFLLYIGCICMLVSALVVYSISTSISQPILELTEISKRVANLQFDAEYEPSVAGNEIDELGLNINEMSDKLKTAIDNLTEANSKLQEDIDRKTKTEEMRRDFLSAVSHELKTPIAIIQGYAEGLEESVLDDEESKLFYCQVIKEEAQKMNQAVKEILSLNQLEYGEDFICMENVNICEVLSGIAYSYDILIKQENIELILPDDEGACGCIVWADEGLIEKVISNYFSNAIHYAKGEPKQIKVFFEEKGDLLRINVFNTGDPIADEDIGRVWDKFYKADKARTREYGGTGIGLSVVKAVMDSFHRECGVYNTEDGVVFWFELERK